MESIILNLLNLTGEERAAFAVLAPQRFHPDGAGLTVEDWAVRPGNSGQPAAGVPAGEHRPALAPHPQCRGGPLYAPGVLPSEAALTCSTGAYGLRCQNTCSHCCWR